jgi:hypothetical protein
MTHAIIIITNVDSVVLDDIKDHIKSVKGKDSVFTIMVGEVLK